MIKVKRLNHVTVTVTDLERAREFYQGVLGLQPLERPPYDFPGVWFLCGEQGIHLELDPPISRHIAIEVADIKEIHRMLKGKGVSILQAPAPRPNGSLYMYIRDPDGNVIELAER